MPRPICRTTTPRQLFNTWLQKWLMFAAREHRRSDHLLGFSKPRNEKRSCLRQVGRCFGVCEGVETPAQHAERLRVALAANALPAWPFAGPAVLKKRTPRMIAATYSSSISGARFQVVCGYRSMPTCTVCCDGRCGKTASRFRATGNDAASEG